VLKKFYKLFRVYHSDRTKKYWEMAANKPLEITMEKICQNFDRNTFESKKESIVTNIQLSPEKTILDLACGIGRTCRWVAPHVKQYHGVDFVDEMVKKARAYNEMYTNAIFHVNDGRTLSIFKNDFFDIVYSELAFQHMPKDIQRSYVKETHRVLKKNGLFYVDIPRIEFYQDNSYALTKEETENLFKGFEIDIGQQGSAYYRIKAKKID
jgi:ubiquinone/menaquinone biosynthesis C-methylase UbiE